jgi:trimeric autotransporter adhesin
VDQAALRQKDEKREMGFIAQDVEKTMREMGLDVSNLLHAPSDDHDNYSIAYGQLVVPLVKAVQEQQAQIKGQQAEIAQLRQQLDQQQASFEARLSALEKAQPASASTTPSTQK